jgi:membrane-associated phospholipid phosphatase
MAAASFWSTWGSYLNEISATVLLICLAFSTDGISGASIPQVIERDLTLSYALSNGMSLGVLILISVAFPFAVVTLCCIADYLFVKFGLCKPSRGQITSFKAHLYHYGFVLLGLVQALMLTKLVTDIIKLWARVPRPLAFALCDYQGYRNAASTGNFTSYWAVTTSGVFADLSKCQGTASQIREAFLSFPSGHSSISFAGTVFTVYFLRGFFKIRKSYFFSWQSFLTFLPILLAFWAAISRVVDRWHSTADITAGAIIGCLGATIGWRNYAALERSLFPVVRAANNNGPYKALLEEKQSGDEITKINTTNNSMVTAVAGATAGSSSPLLPTQRSSSTGATAPPL